MRVAAAAAIGLAVVVTTGALTEAAAERREAKEVPRIGRAVDVGGRTLNIYCSGTGSPTVVFESNWGAPGFRWRYVQRAVARFTRACWYDRAGLGWSDPGPFPNHSDAIARDLHAVLANVGENGPYVLVAHGMGAFHARVFRALYPRDVAGLVFVDPLSEDLTVHIHNHIEAFRPTVLLIRRTLGAIGFARLMRPALPPPAPGWMTRDWSILVRLRRQTKSRVAAGQEPPLWISGELARAAGAFGDIPVIVLTAGIQDQEEDPKLDGDHALKVALHEKLARLSSRGAHVIVRSGHDVPDEAPGAVVDAVRQVLAQTPTRP
jgi:pimeloyl-ACP methyl ester carboxylesterase